MSALVPDGRFTFVGDDLLHCDGSGAPLTNIYPVEKSEVGWAGWQKIQDGMPPPAQMTSLIFETSSPEWVAEVGLLLAAASEASMWFVDSKDIAWPVGEVDPNRIALA